MSDESCLGYRISNTLSHRRSNERYSYIYWGKSSVDDWCSQRDYTYKYDAFTRLADVWYPCFDAGVYYGEPSDTTMRKMKPKNAL